MRSGTKWTIIIASCCLVIVALGIVLTAIFSNKQVLHVVAVEHTAYKTSDFTGSELKFFENGTFHVQIFYQKDTLYFIGIGTYTKDNSNYKLTFTKARTRQNNTMVDATYTEPVVCPISGQRIKFTAHNSQVYYFG